MRDTVKIGCVALGLFVASYQQGAAGTSSEKTSPQLNPAAFSRVSEREGIDHRRATLPNDAAESRHLAPATVLNARALTAVMAAVSPAGQLNRFDREVIDAHRAPPAPAQPGRASATPAPGGDQRVVPEQPAWLKRPMPAPAGREMVPQPGLKTDLKQRPADQARETGPGSVRRSSFDAVAVPAGSVNRLDPQAVEARRRTPDAVPSIRAVPEKTPPDRRLSAPGPTE